MLTMNELVELFIANTDLMYKEPGRDEESICSAEEKIGMKLAKDYREFVSSYAMFDCCGVEYVVPWFEDLAKYTLFWKNAAKCFPPKMYVIGKPVPDCGLILQDSNGEIYEFDTYYENAAPTKIANSFLEYMNNEYARMLTISQN